MENHFLFSMLEDFELVIAGKAFELVELNKEAHLMELEEEGETFYFIREGSIGVYRLRPATPHCDTSFIVSLASPPARTAPFIGRKSCLFLV